LNIGAMTLLRFAPIVVEFFGTLFVWFDTQRLNERNPPHRIAISDDSKWDKWYYRKAGLGFSLLLLGIFLQGVTLTTVSVYEVRPELILAIATVILALVTAWMAVETRRMARAAKKTVELEQMPILGFRDLKLEAGKQAGQQPTLASLRVGMEVFNAGRVPVKYKVKSFSVMFANQGTSSGQFLSRGSRVLPGSSTIFWHPALSLNPPVSTFPAVGQVRFEYEYSDESGGQLQSIVEKVDYTVSPIESGFHVNWLMVD